MNTTGHDSSVAASRKTKFLILLISLLAMMVLEPFLADQTRLKFLLEIFFTIILFTSIFAVSEKNWTALVAILLALPKLGTTWALHYSSHMLLYFIDSLTGFLFTGFIIVVILSHIFKQDQVTLETIYGAIVVYVLIGIMWVFLYKFTEVLHPHSFSIPGILAHDSRKSLYYYSFVTLTTLGYGDITPMSDSVRSLAVLEAIVGQMYIAVLIARLVGLHISQRLIGK